MTIVARIYDSETRNLIKVIEVLKGKLGAQPELFIHIVPYNTNNTLTIIPMDLEWPRQIELGDQTEQAPPSVVFQLRHENMRGFRIVTILVAPYPTVSWRPPLVAFIAMGFNPHLL